MTIADITPYLIELQREYFTGEVRLNFHGGLVSKIIKKLTVDLEDEPS